MKNKHYFVLNTCDCGAEVLEEVKYSNGKIYIPAYCPHCIKKHPLNELIIKIIERRTMEKKEIVKIVKQLDSKLKPSEPAFKVGCVLLASAMNGAHEPSIAKLLDLPLDDVQEWGERLRANKVWVGKNVNADWMDPQSSGIAFWLDAQVAMGLLIRDKEKKYKMTEAARKYVEKGFKGEVA